MNSKTGFILRSAIIILGTAALFTPPFLIFSEGLESRESVILLPDAREYRFQSFGKKMFSGDAAESGTKHNCSGEIPDSETAGNFAVISTLYQNGCWTDGRYNHRNWPAEYGELAENGSEEEKAGPFPALKIFPAQKKAEQFLGSRHRLAFRIPEKKSYSLYMNQGDSWKLISEIKESEAVPGSFYIFRDTDLSVLDKESVFAVTASGTEFGPLRKIKDRTKGARFANTPWGYLEKIQVSVNGEPFDTAMDFTAGPGDHSNIYGISRQFFYLPVKETAGGILWQDKKTGNVILTEVNDFGVFLSEKTVYKPGTRELLLAAASDRKGHIYFFTGGTGKDTNEGSLTLKMIKVSAAEGRIVKEQKYSSAKNKGLNVFSIADNHNSSQWVASLEYNGGVLGLILSRTMHKSADGLNHQGAIAVTFSAEDLSLISNLGQTSGHSFGNFIIPDGESEFAAVDLADNYPRGIHLHRIYSNRKESRVVFTFKTAHGQSSKSPAGKQYPLYGEISKGGKNYYQWSNDNRTYTETGGLAPAPQGYLILAATERPMLDNARSDENHNDPRDLALVIIKKDFQTVKASSWNVVSKEMVLSEGESGKSAFYDFGGKRNEQENNGVIWLTKFSGKDTNASRPRIIRIAEDRYFILYEEWNSKSYIRTWAMEVNASGSVTVKPVSLGNTVRVGRQDDIYFINGKITIINGHRKDGKIEIITFSL